MLGAFSLNWHEKYHIHFRKAYIKTIPIKVEFVLRLVDKITEEFKKNDIVTQLLDFDNITWWDGVTSTDNTVGRHFYSRDDVIESIQKKYKYSVRFIDDKNRAIGCANVSFLS